MIEIVFLEKLPSAIPNEPPKFARMGPPCHQLVNPDKIAVAKSYKGYITSVKDGDEFCTYENEAAHILELTMDGGAVVYTVYEERIHQTLKRKPTNLVGYGAYDTVPEPEEGECGVDFEEAPEDGETYMDFQSASPSKEN